jgi:hypothetical protein
MKKSTPWSIAIFVVLCLGPAMALLGWRWWLRRPPTHAACVAFAVHEQELIHGEDLAKVAPREYEITIARETQHCLVWMARPFVDCYAHATTPLATECRRYPRLRSP